jgi:Ca-activated chloride channel family protein
VATVLILGMAAFSLSGASRPRSQSQEPAGALFSTRTELVVLHVVVKDRDGRYVPDLPAAAFRVLENGKSQNIRFVAPEDAPVTIGLLIDSSGSMSSARQQIAAAAGAFVQTSHPKDDIFALVFNEQVRAVLPADAPFTSNPATMRGALAGAISPWGRTMLHDAILSGLDYLDRGRYERKVLVIVSDGGDNASTVTFDRVVTQLETSNAAVYTIAFVDPVQRDVNPGRLRRIARATGGEAFEPEDIGEVEDVLAHIARDIRHAYTLGYAPTETGVNSRLRELRVVVNAPGGVPLTVRTRQGYSLEPQ